MSAGLSGNYTVSAFPKARLWLLDILTRARKLSPMHGIIDVDVSDALKCIRAHRERTGEIISFNAFLIRCVAKMVEEHPELNAYRLGRRRLVTFHTVDIATPIERVVQGRKVPVMHVVRAAETKKADDIQTELRHAQQAPPPSDTADAGWTRWLRDLPESAERFLVDCARSDPRLRQRIDGTVLVSNIIQPGHWLVGRGSVPCSAAGRGATPCSLSLGVFFVSLGKQPWVVDDQVVARDILRFDIVADHAVVDGAVLSRATQRLVDLLQSGFELPQAIQQPMRQSHIGSADANPTLSIV